MSDAAIEQVIRSVLYEGYMLYPYRRSALKNRRRWTFGVLHPEAWTASGRDREACALETECLLAAEAGARLRIEARFMRLAPGAANGEAPAEEERVAVPELGIDRDLGSEVVHRFRRGALEGEIRAHATPLRDGVVRVSARVVNLTPWAERPGEEREAERERLLEGSLLSTLVLLEAPGSRFLSWMDPPEAFASETAACRNAGAWPVLVGAGPKAEAMLAAPIILYDYPRIAPESPGDLFDGTEIDELLTLRLRALTEEEANEIRAGDPRARGILDRAESMTASDMAALHGARRAISNGAFGPGDRVRLRPRPGGDVFDLALGGRTALVESIEEDLEGRCHVAVVVEDDPGRDLGALRQPGHRFFFAPDELERLG